MLTPRATGTVVPKSMVWNYLATLSNALWITFVLCQDIPKALDKIVNNCFAQSLCGWMIFLVGDHGVLSWHVPMSDQTLI